MLAIANCFAIPATGKTLSLLGLLVPLFEVEGKILPPGHPVVGVLDEPYSAKLAHRSSHTGPPVYRGWNRVHPSNVAWRSGPVWLFR